MKIFYRTGITPAVSRLTDSVPGLAARMLDAARREERYRWLAQGTMAAPQQSQSQPGAAAAQPASPGAGPPASEGWISRARSTYERVIVPALSAQSDSTLVPVAAIETAQADKAAPAGAGSDAVVPPVRREKPVTPPAEPAAPETQAEPTAPTPPPASAQSASKPAAKKDEPYASRPLGVLDRVNDWLARANREYQSTIVKGLSSPSSAGPSEDAIAKKIEEDKSAEVKKAQEAAAQKAAADQAAEGAKKAEAERKAAEAKQLEADRKKAEETRKLADEASRKADEILNEAQKTPDKPPEKSAEKPAEKPVQTKPEPQPKVATPAAPPPVAQPAPQVKADDAESKAAEAQLRAEEARKQEEARKAEAARRAQEEQTRAAAREAEERAAAERRSAEAESAKHARRAIVLTPEPIARPEAQATDSRPERGNGYRTAYVQDTAVRQRLTIYHEGRNGRIRGPVVKRWIWRTHTWSGGGKCRYAGRRITPPARYTVARGDSLWRISEKHYANGARYPRIYRANRALIADPDLIYPCQRFRVPRR